MAVSWDELREVVAHTLANPAYRTHNADEIAANVVAAIQPDIEELQNEAYRRGRTEALKGNFVAGEEADG